MGTYRRWNEKDALLYGLELKVLNDKSRVFKYKDAWVTYNKLIIIKVAVANSIPPEILGAVAYAEVGGDPYNQDELFFMFRSLAWSGPKWIDKILPNSQHPRFTSFGSVQIQLRRVAETLGLNGNNLNSQQMHILKNIMRDDVINLDIVAKHLRDLVILDNPEMRNSCFFLSDEAIKILGARYNRGTELSLEKIKQDTSYGNVMVKKYIPRVKELLK